MFVVPKCFLPLFPFAWWSRTNNLLLYIYIYIQPQSTPYSQSWHEMAQPQYYPPQQPPNVYYPTQGYQANPAMSAFKDHDPQDPHHPNPHHPDQPYNQPSYRQESSGRPVSRGSSSSNTLATWLWASCCVYLACCCCPCCCWSVWGGRQWGFLSNIWALSFVYVTTLCTLYRVHLHYM